MSSMERVVSALQKVEAMKLNEKENFEQLRSELIKKIQEAVNNQPEVVIKLEAEKAANHLLPSILKGMPNVETLEKKIDELFEKKVNSTENMLIQTQKEINSKNTFFTYFSAVLIVFCILLGMATWHYSYYKVDAYKYNFLKKDRLINTKGREGLFNSLDSLAINDFGYVQKFVDTTDVEKILRERKVKTKE